MGPRTRPHFFSTLARPPHTPRRALTIHKSQGMSLDFLRISIDDCFAEGQVRPRAHRVRSRADVFTATFNRPAPQVYVALSRMRSRQGCEVRNFRESCVRADPRALKFHAIIDAARERQAEGAGAAAGGNASARAGAVADVSTHGASPASCS